jgi:Pilus formation protein N terminal region
VNLPSIVRPATAAAIVVLSALAIPEASAQDPQSGAVQAVTGSAQRITMTMGKGQLFKTSVPFTKVSVTDDKIVDVTPQSNREFVFTPKGIGSTNVLVFDEKNALIATLDINVVGTAAREVRAETHNNEIPNVKIYNFPWRGTGPGGAVKSLANPTFYRCNLTNCDLALTPDARASSATAAPYAGGVVGEALSAGPGPTGTTTANPQEGAPAENEKPPQCLNPPC